MIYIINFKPYEEKTMNRLELFNESFILLTSITALAFTDFVKDKIVQVSVGYFMIGLVVFNLISNMGYILIQSIKNCKRMRKRK